MARPESEDATLGLSAPEPPDRGEWIDPWNDRTLLAYYEKLHYWHGYLRFLGLPHLEDNPDVPIEDLYVEPKLSEAQISPDTPLDEWPERMDVLQALIEHPRLVILGDPGTGKSSLVDWIIYRLTQSLTTEWRDQLGLLVPIPMVLRELDINASTTWDDLLQTFLDQPIAEPLGTDKLEHLLATGQAFVLLDGIDELGGRDPREALRRSVFPAFAQYPTCRWLLTSRIVGYDEVPLDQERFIASSRTVLEKNISQDTNYEKAIFSALRRRAHQVIDQDSYAYIRAILKEGHQQDINPNIVNRFYRAFLEESGIILASRTYLAPFDDDQIASFAQNWYALRDVREEDRASKARDLIEAVHAHQHIERLARIPNLLTLIALIHRVRAHLPNGRTLLYEKIAEAYLDSIDRYRKIEGVGSRLAEKKRWLARIGWEMQLRRARQERPKRGEEGEILVERDTVERWLTETMAESTHREPDLSAREFLDYIGRRSGLLLPRGQDQYAFTHLSFQEYFAAVYIANKLQSPSWLRGKPPEELSEDALSRYASEPVWRETLIFLAELLADDPEWPSVLAELLFGDDFLQIASAASSGEDELAKSRWKAQLLAELLVDPHSGWQQSERNSASQVLWAWNAAWQTTDASWHPGPRDLVLSILTRARPPALEPVMQGLRRFLQNDQPEELRLTGRLLKSYLAGNGAHLPAQLELTDVRDLSSLPLKDLQHLQSLDLMDTQVQGTKPLIALQKLQTLDLSFTQTQDIEPLKNLQDLRRLHLSHTQIQDIEPLAALQKLQALDLSFTLVDDIAPIQTLQSLQTLDLGGTEIEDISPLRTLEKLQLIILDEDREGDQVLRTLQKKLPKLKIHFLGSP